MFNLHIAHNARRASALCVVCIHHSWDTSLSPRNTLFYNYEKQRVGLLASDYIPYTLHLIISIYKHCLFFLEPLCTTRIYFLVFVEGIANFVGSCVYFMIKA